MRLKCNYCPYTCLSPSMLDVHMAKYHEAKLANASEEARDNAPLPEHPAWPQPHRDGIGHKDCPACHGVGMVTINVPITDPRWGKAQYCPQCYPGIGAVPRQSQAALTRR